MQGWYLPLYCTENPSSVALIMVAGSYFASLPVPDFSLCGGDLRLPHSQEQLLFISSSSAWANL